MSRLPMQIVAQELRDLAAVLADWCTPAPAATLFLFGSRVRGDHRPDSDVDVSIAWGRISDADMDWWMKNNQELFVTIDGKLPGKLQILEENDPVTLKAGSEACAGPRAWFWCLGGQASLLPDAA
jgi:predicted nucleotidyltransferase